MDFNKNGKMCIAGKSLNLLKFAPLLALAACATPEPGIEVRVVEKVVEVQRPCPGTVPARPAPLGTLANDATAALAQVLATLADYSAPGKYADQAEGYFRVCPPSG